MSGGEGRRSTGGEVGVRRKPGSMVAVLGDRGKIQAVAAMIDVQASRSVINMTFLAARLCTGIDDVAASLRIVLQAHLSAGTEAPGKPLRLTRPHKQVGEEADQEKEMAETKPDREIHVGSRV